MILQGQVGPQVLADGSNSTVRTGKLGDAIFSELEPKYYEQAYRGNVFFSVAQTVTFSAQNLTSQTQTGLLITNPSGSNKNLVPIQSEIALTALVANTNTFFQAGAVVQPYSTTAITNTTAGTVYSSLGAKSSGAGSIAASSVSWGLPVAPVLYKVLFTAAVTTTTYISGPSANSIITDYNGAIIIPPGCSFGICGSLADTGHVTMSWMEIAV